MKPLGPEHQQAHLPRPLRLWHLDCAAITALLGLGFRPLDLRERVERHATVACPVARRDAVWAFWAAHRACHAENPLSVELEQDLCERDEGVLRWARRAAPHQVRRAFREDGVPASELPAVLYALATDPDAGKRSLAQYLIHAQLMRGLGLFGAHQLDAAPTGLDGETPSVDALAREVESLRSRLEERTRRENRLLDYVSRLRREREAV